MHTLNRLSRDGVLGCTSAPNGFIALPHGQTVTIVVPRNHFTWLRTRTTIASSVHRLTHDMRCLHD
eukprot:6046414-Pleurochrysis_carterae.AAC.1